MKNARITSSGRAPEVSINAGIRDDMFRLSSIGLNTIPAPTLRDRATSIQTILACVIVGRMTSYDESTLAVKFYGEFQLHDLRTDERYQAPKLTLPALELLINLLEDFGADSGPMFFGMKLFEEPGQSVFRFERMEDL